MAYICSKCGCLEWKEYSLDMHVYAIDYQKEVTVEEADREYGDVECRHCYNPLCLSEDLIEYDESKLSPDEYLILENKSVTEKLVFLKLVGAIGGG